MSVPVDPLHPEGPWADAGWSEVPLEAYARVVTLALNSSAASPLRAAVLVLSNDPPFAEALAAEVRRRHSDAAVLTVVTASADDARDDRGDGDGGGGDFDADGAQGRGRLAVMGAAVEWFALSRCDLVVGAQGSAFAKTACLRSAETAGVELVPRAGPRLLGLVAMDGGLDLLDLNTDDGARSPSPACREVDVGPASVLRRAWGLGGAVCEGGRQHQLLEEEEEEEEEGSGLVGGAAAVAMAVRRLHVGRPTAEREGEATTLEALRGAGDGHWTVVDLAIGMAQEGSGGGAPADGPPVAMPGVALVEVPGMAQLGAFKDGTFDDL
jgi:hypothetical protein